MRRARAVEEEIWAEWRGWGEVFGAWAGTVSGYDEERAGKRLRTRVAFTRNREEGLEERRVHCEFFFFLFTYFFTLFFSTFSTFFFFAPRVVWGGGGLRERGGFDRGFLLMGWVVDIKVVQAFEGALALLGDG